MNSKQPVNRENFSSPLYSEAIIHGGLIYCSGKVGLDPKTGNLMTGGVAEETVCCHRVSYHSFIETRSQQTAALALLDSVLKAAGSDLTRLLKVSSFGSSTSAKLISKV